MVEIRLIIPSRREFQKDVYKPGIISLSRILWGSLGGGLLLFIIAIFAQTTGVGVLYPPLAATCFINATCVFLRVARPKAVIVGHFVSTIGGLLGVFIGDVLFFETDLHIPAKLGLAVLFAAMFMQILDADHPPAAATAAIPALFPVIPLPCENLVLPIHMAWGGVIAVMFAVVWNRIWFEWPVNDNKPDINWFNLNMDKPDIIGTVICVAAFILMCLKPISQHSYILGSLIMLIGIIILSVHHFFGISIVTKKHLTNDRKI
ncbi:MAG: HPP family protein [Candidatus Hodarchaeales archaeon]